MKLHYYKHTEEVEEYLTWEFISFEDAEKGEDYGWKKKPTPNFTSRDIEGHELAQYPKGYAQNYIRISNIEDKHFIEMEIEAAKNYWRGEIEDICRALNELK